MKLRGEYKRLSQLSWTIATTEKKYPPDTLTESEEEELIKYYLALSLDLEDINKNIKEEYKKYNKTRKDKNAGEA